jgi:NAD(P)-dependent dehydrogenase (short-subunit alcohol dehydrogenase family)
MRIAITGAATGIGAETVTLLKAKGHEITAFDIAEPVNADLWIPVDMADLAAIDAAAAQAEGPFDVLISNAGLPPRDGNAVDVLAVNVLGLRAMTRALLPKLADGARIVNTASRAGADWRANIDEVKALLAIEDPAALPAFVAARAMTPTRAYCLSKEAVIVLTKGWTRALLNRNIRANSVSPSAVETRILGDFVTALGERAEKGMELAGRAGSAAEIARLIVFLASEDSNWIKGEDHLIDGGISAMVDAQIMGFETGV